MYDRIRNREVSIHLMQSTRNQIWRLCSSKRYNTKCYRCTKHKLIILSSTSTGYHWYMSTPTMWGHMWETMENLTCSLISLVIQGVKRLKAELIDGHKTDRKGQMSPGPLNKKWQFFLWRSVIYFHLNGRNKYKHLLFGRLENHYEKLVKNMHPILVNIIRKHRILKTCV